MTKLSSLLGELGLRTNHDSSTRNILFIARGLPGSGKSTNVKAMHLFCLRANISSVICSSDNFFTCPSCEEYHFDLAKLRFAHSWCRERCEEAMRAGVCAVFIDNTNCSLREMRPYVEFAQQFNYDVQFLEPKTPWAFDVDELVKRNVHRVPREAIERMLSRWVPDASIDKVLGGVQSGLMSEDERAAFHVVPVA